MRKGSDPAPPAATSAFLLLAVGPHGQPPHGLRPIAWQHPCDRRPRHIDLDTYRLQFVHRRVGAAAGRQEERGFQVNKVFPSAKAALDGVDQGRTGAGRRRLRPVRHSRSADRGGARHRRQEPHRHLQQCRRRRLRSRRAAADAPDQEDDLVLRRREQGVRAAVSRRRAGARVHAAGHARREAAGGRRRHPGVLHQDRVTARSSPRASRSRSSTGRSTSWSGRSRPTWRWSRPGRATSPATSSTG